MPRRSFCLKLGYLVNLGVHVATLFEHGVGALRSKLRNRDTNDRLGAFQGSLLPLIDDRLHDLSVLVPLDLQSFVDRLRGGPDR